jgi:hypothetical protein
VADVIDFNFDPGPIFGFFAFFFLFAFGFMIWMVVDVIRRPEAEFPSPGAKTGWTAGLIIGLFFTPLGFVAALVYFFSVVIPARNRQATPAWTAPVSAPPGSPPVPPQQAPPTNCRNCGAKLVAGARFCHSCGAAAI